MNLKVLMDFRQLFGIGYPNHSRRRHSQNPRHLRPGKTHFLAKSIQKQHPLVTYSVTGCHQVSA